MQSGIGAERPFGRGSLTLVSPVTAQEARYVYRGLPPPFHSGF
ncbi:hypothetical protein FLA_5158 [Filimonas lacunae]|nr:hypothetical protein FLA_5158 [Filimonas lacunae]